MPLLEAVGVGLGGTSEGELITVRQNLSAGFLAYRALMATKLGEQEAVRAAATGLVLGELHRNLESYWLQMFAPALISGFNISGKDLDNDFVAAAAGKYSGDMAMQINEVSDRAFIEGYNAALNKGWDRAVAWDRISKAYGLDPVQMRAWVTYYPEGGYTTQEIPDTSRVLLDKSLIARSERIGDHEAWTVYQLGKQTSWSMKTAHGDIPLTAEKVWETATDELVCPTCAPLDRIAVPINEEFRTPVGNYFTPPLHINCRCNIKLHFEGEVTKIFGADQYDRDKNGRFAISESRRIGGAPQPQQQRQRQQRRLSKADEIVERFHLEEPSEISDLIVLGPSGEPNQFPEPGDPTTARAMIPDFQNLDPDSEKQLAERQIKELINQAKKSKAFLVEGEEDDEADDYGFKEEDFDMEWDRPREEKQWVEPPAEEKPDDEISQWIDEKSSSKKHTIRSNRSAERSAGKNAYREFKEMERQPKERPAKFKYEQKEPEFKQKEERKAEPPATFKQEEGKKKQEQKSLPEIETKEEQEEKPPAERGEEKREERKQKSVIANDRTLEDVWEEQKQDRGLDEERRVRGRPQQQDYPQETEEERQRWLIHQPTGCEEYDGNLIATSSNYTVEGDANLEDIKLNQIIYIKPGTQASVDEYYERRAAVEALHSSMDLSDEVSYIFVFEDPLIDQARTQESREAVVYHPMGFYRVTDAISATRDEVDRFTELGVQWTVKPQSPTRFSDIPEKQYEETHSLPLADEFRDDATRQWLNEHKDDPDVREHLQEYEQYERDLKEQEYQSVEYGADDEDDPRQAFWENPETGVRNIVIFHLVRAEEDAIVTHGGRDMGASLEPADLTWVD